MLLSKDFSEFIELLNKHKVDYMIVGGYAMAFHGKPRQTGDIDIWIDNVAVNAERVMKVIQDFGLSSLGLKKEDFIKENSITQIGFPPLRIDILNSIDGVRFNDAREHRLVVEMQGIKAFYIGKEEFLKNKQASGRVQDLADIKELQKDKGKKKGRGR